MAAGMALVRGSLGNPAPAEVNPDAPPANDVGSETSLAEGLAKYIRDAYDTAKRHRQTQGIDDDLLDALRAVRGKYSPEQLAAIHEMDGSDVYARISANKVRSVAAMLREIYAGVDRPWGIDPTSDPEMAADPMIEETIQKIIMAEVQEIQLAQTQNQLATQQAQAMGQPAPPPVPQLTAQMLYDRRRSLRDLLYQHKQQDARDAMRLREDKIDDILQEGGFYQALWDFLLDIPTFPFAVLKGPVVYYKNKLHWENGKPVVKSEPTMTWERCSPFDVYFAPWSQRVQDGYIIHHQRATRATLQSLIGLPSYNSEAIMSILEREPASMKTWFDYIEYERADLEGRDNDHNTSGSDAVDRPFPMLEFHGPVSGKLLVEWGMDAAEVPDDSKDLEITGWLIDDTVIGVRLNPHPMETKPFYVDSFERVPGSIYGLGVPKMIEDIQDAGNATLRALVNNMAIASGPQVAVNEPRLNSNDTEIKMYPWKVWSFTDDPTGTGNTPPIQFFQPTSNAPELLGVFEKFMQMADEFSSMPRYLQGNAQGVATVGRTSSGLSMLMDAANRTMKQTVTSIDNNVIKQAVIDLHTFLALLRPDIVDDGDINVVARGATELLQREQLRMRRLQFLQVTGNPIDMAIIGQKGRANIIKEIARDLNLPTDEVVTGMPQATMAPPGAAPPGPPGAAPGAAGLPAPAQGMNTAPAPAGAPPGPPPAADAAASPPPA